jgi:hypothetical protein
VARAYTRVRVCVCGVQVFAELDGAAEGAFLVMRGPVTNSYRLLLRSKGSTHVYDIADDGPVDGLHLAHSPQIFMTLKDLVDFYQGPGAQMSHDLPCPLRSGLLLGGSSNTVYSTKVPGEGRMPRLAATRYRASRCPLRRAVYGCRVPTCTKKPRPQARLARLEATKPRSRTPSGGSPRLIAMVVQLGRQPFLAPVPTPGFADRTGRSLAQGG